MPITPLHFGVLAPVNHFTSKVSNQAFILANVIADVPVVLHVYAQKVEDLGGPHTVGTLHDVFSHNYVGALCLGLVLGAFGFKSFRWWYGCLLGTLSHVFLDSFVHSDMKPFVPWSNENPFYIDGAYHVISIVLLPLVGWLMLEWRDNSQRKRTLEKARG